MILRSHSANRLAQWIAQGLLLCGLGWSVFAVGCSPSVSSGGSGGSAGASNGPGASNTAGASSTTETTTPDNCGWGPDCPQDYSGPAPGSPCSVEGLCCSYSQTDHAGGEDVWTVSCVNGKWH